MENSIDVVIDRIDDAECSPRFQRIMESLVSHLHGFVKDVELTQAEWETAIDFLTRTGKMCSEERQEFILLSDTLGVSMLVDAINNNRDERATENTVLGPFHVAGAPDLEMGTNISKDGIGETCRYVGRVLDLDGNAIEGADLDVWSDNANGFYDVQQPDIQPKWNNRGIFTTGADGTYDFIGIKPVSYPVPVDGPAGEMLSGMGRHPNRPAHMHMIVTAPGLSEADHAHLRRGRSLHRVRRGVRRQEVAHGTIRPHARFRHHMELFVRYRPRTCRPVTRKRIVRRGGLETDRVKQPASPVGVRGVRP